MIGAVVYDDLLECNIYGNVRCVWFMSPGRLYFEGYCVAVLHQPPLCACFQEEGNLGNSKAEV